MSPTGGTGLNVPRSLIPSAETIGKTLWRIELIVTVAAGVVAALVAIFLIYEPNKSWGGRGDVFALFAWGVGLHQIGNVAGLGGVRAVADKIAGVTPPAG